MRPSEWISLLACVIVGTLWVFLGQNALFLNVFAGWLVGPGLNLQDFLQTGSSPSFTVLWIGCLTALLIWYWHTFSRSTRSSAEVRRMRGRWWLAALLLVLFGWFSQLTFTVFRWQVTGTSPLEGGGVNYYPVPPMGWILLLVVVVLDVILLFWLPTVLASPRSHRFVVPGAVTLRGGR
ncbi:hypothetical protein KBY66_01675 [Synechococcus sp. Tobar12-5m-g]|uniref:hypothetical protein n=1 Tax=unclassified Synechococcus TaxID=2626047 RepID=UPI0020CDE15E|nr:MULTISPECIES: hypothetical protein [unclassified Synechococcus]MCP9771346.1 hypothetical protein [Synechococcus sp. Tobar12-5m-g]MCP9872285.1 hypothetical protein [Synechococcus sp. Cruz CV-v-12]